MSQSPLLPIILKTVSGDSDAFEQLIISQKRNISFIIRGITSCPEDVEDISQEVAVLVFQRISSLRRPESFFLWLHTIVVRESWRLVTARIPVVSFCAVDDSGAWLAETDLDCLPAAHTERIELRIEVCSALRRIPEKFRKVLTLHYFCGMRCHEIADFLGTTVGTVSAHLSRARKRIRKEFPAPEPLLS
ncbi:MAG: sigma-70 family RNA polymerase sigma factor [Clostridiales bacterium]|nr:sigma-70 family RNA polymerase sigma factor [Clostridiales bacterium]